MSLYVLYVRMRKGVEVEVDLDNTKSTWFING